MRYNLFPFQETGVEFLTSRKRALNCDSMGLGKSIQAMESVRRLSLPMDKTNTLIVCPASLTLMWDRFLRQWFHDEDFEVVHMKGVKSAVHFTKKRRFVIVSYNYIQKPENVERLKKLRWHFILSDESHAMKNFKSKTCKGFRNLIKGYTGYMWLFTGTPATRSGQDYYPFLEFIQPGKWGTLSEFSEMFCNVSIDYWSGGKRYEGVKDSKRPVLRRAFKKIMIRRRKEEVLKELPSRIDSTVPVTVPDDLVNESKHIPADIIKKAVETGVLTSEHVARMMRAIGIAKVDAAVEYLLGLEEPIVVFCCHHDVVNSIADALKKAGRSYRTVTGEDSRVNKDQAVQDFQNGKVNVILCNIKAGGVGLTMHRASHMLLVEMDWSPAVMEQAIARVERIGQKASCINVTHLIAHGTIDEQVLETLKYKSTFMKQVMGDI